MRSEFRQVGKKVDAFDQNIGSTKLQVGNLADKMAKAAMKQQKYRNGAREAA